MFLLVFSKGGLILGLLGLDIKYIPITASKWKAKPNPNWIIIVSVKVSVKSCYFKGSQSIGIQSPILYSAINIIKYK